MPPSELQSAVARIRRRALPAWQHTRRLLHDLRLLVFEITQRCNLACLHCGSDCSRSVTQPDLPYETVERVLEEVADAYQARRITVMLGGGEPLLHPDVFRIARRARALGFRWGMVTNGLLWDDAAFRAARAARAGSISVSLDGPEATHDGFRGRPGSHAAAVRTIRRLLDEVRVPVLDVITCVGPHTLPVLEETWSLLVALGVPGWRLIPISPIGRARGNPRLLLDRDGFRALLEAIAKFRACGGMPVYLSESNYIGPCLEPYVRDQEYFCRAGVNVGGVMADGDILACANIDRRFRQGNVAEDSFVDTWEHRFQVFRDRRWMRQGPCVDCNEWKWCLGNSFHNWDRDAERPGLCQFKAFDLGGFEMDPTIPVVRRAPGPVRRPRHA
jgi:radical SAM protein with 4Fe4S-binding SPASM domain